MRAGVAGLKQVRLDDAEQDVQFRGQFASLSMMPDEDERTVRDILGIE